MHRYKMDSLAFGSAIFSDFPTTSSSSFEFEFELARSFLILRGSKTSSCLIRCSFAYHLHKLKKRSLDENCSNLSTVEQNVELTRVPVTRFELPELVEQNVELPRVPVTRIELPELENNSTFCYLRAT